MKRISTLVVSLVFFIGCGSMDHAVSESEQVAQSGSALTTETTISTAAARSTETPTTLAPPDEQASTVAPTTEGGKPGSTTNYQCDRCWARCQHPAGGWGTWHYIGSQSNCGGAALDYCLARVGGCQGAMSHCGINP